MSKGTVYKLPLSFFVSLPSPQVARAIEELIRENTKYELESKWTQHPISKIKVKETKEIPVARFCCSTADKRNHGFLLKDLDRFYELCHGFGIRKDELEIIDFKPYNVIKCDFGLKGFKPREHQVPAIKHLSRSNDRKISVLESATGTGKTAMSIYHMAKQGVLTVFSMNPGHLTTWRSELKAFTTVTDEDIYEFTGGESIRKAIELKKKGEFNYKIILTSAATTRNFLKEYELQGSENFSYDVTPIGLWAFFGVGLVVRDEVHEAIHTLVKQSIYCTAPESLYLSATLVSDDRFINRIYDKVFPPEVIWRSANNKYLMMHPLFYGNQKMISGRSFKGYSHVSYEKTIMKKKGTLERYLNLMTFSLDLWKQEYKPGKKVMFIAATIKMCELIRDKLKAYAPDYSCDMYVQGSPKEHLYERDIIIGTPGSVGTGVNVPNLSLVVLTVAIGSTQRSIQIAGRPREIKLYPEDPPRFIYFVNQENNSHMKYHEKRIGYMTMRIKGRKDIQTNYRI